MRPKRLYLIVYLKKEGDKTTVLEGKDRPQKSFGANIHDLLADSFFIGDGLIGDFAKEKINETIEELKKDGTYKKIYDKWFGAE